MQHMEDHWYHCLKHCLSDLISFNFDLDEQLPDEDEPAPHQAMNVGKKNLQGTDDGKLKHVALWSYVLLSFVFNLSHATFSHTNAPCL